MKNLKLFLVATAAILFITACKKDENGNRITYYKNKTGEGYVFFKFKNDSIAPVENVKIEIESYTVGMFSTITRHYDYVYTDNNGKYFFTFVKKINGEKIEAFYLLVNDFPFSIDSIPITMSGNGIKYNNDILNKSNKISFDTIFFYPKR